MAFLGGKSTGADHILNVLNDPLFDDMDYVEPFLGYAHVLRRVVNKRSYRGSDCNPLLVTLLKAVQQKRNLPTITEREYHALKKQRGNTLRRAVAAFTYSYCGKQFAGFVDDYVRNGKKKSYAEERKRYYAHLQENEPFMSANIRCIDYRTLNYKNKLIYCDPPYANTTGYAGMHLKRGARKNDFDHDQFWETMRKWSKHNIVFVSEYNAPSDFVCVASANKRCTLIRSDAQTLRRGNSLRKNTNGRSIRTENLYCHSSYFQ